MKICNTPGCIAQQEQRAFADDDMVCPICRQPLVAVAEPIDTVNPHIGSGDPGAYGTHPVVAPSPTGNLLALLAVPLIFIGVVGLAAVLAGLLGGFRLPGGATATPIFSDPGLAAAATAAAAATREANLPTVVNTPIIQITPLVTRAPTTVPPPGGPTAAPGAATAVPPAATPIPGNAGTVQGIAVTSQVLPGLWGVRLCGRIAPAQGCDPVTGFRTRDYLYLAIQAGFGPGGARSARVDWYDNTGRLLYASPPQTPALTGTYWLGFVLGNDRPWQSGVYRADIYLDDVLWRQLDIPIND